MKNYRLWASAAAFTTLGTLAAASPAHAVTSGMDAFTGDRSLVPAVVRIDGSRPTGTCSGTLVAPRWVLTAQHCTTSHEARELTVRINKSATNRVRSVKVAGIETMRGYDSSSLVNDVALLRLESAVTDVAPIRLARAPIPAGTNGYTYGFGPTGRSGFWDRVRHPIGGATRNPTKMPRLGEFQVIDRPSCLPRSPLTYVTSVRGFTVQGDSGGPMLEWENGVPTLFNVNAGSYAKQPCRGDKRGWTGVLNRVDTRSDAWRFFLSRHLGRG